MPTFLTLEEVLEIHLDQITRYGGSHGVRDLGLVESAIAQPHATFDNRLLHADICEMAAAYLFHLVQNHPFTDGNKRVGAATALVFLALNDVDIVADEEDLVDLVLEVAQSRSSKPVIAKFFRDHII